jgi:membrane protease YdiL (CAAX protease family)
VKRRLFHFKYELMLCVLLLFLFRVDAIIQYILFQIIGMDYDSVPANVIVIILHISAFAVVIGIGLRDQNKTIVDVCYFKKTSPAVWGAAVLCSIGFVFLNFYLNYLFYRVFTGVDGFYSGGNEPLILPADIVNYALVPAVVEEILFKGVIFAGLKKRYSQRTAIIISSLLFAAAHLNLVRIVPLFLFSCCTFWLYLRTGSLLLPMLIHFINNLFATVLILEPFNSPETFMASQIIFWTGFYLLHRAIPKTEGDVK